MGRLCWVHSWISVEPESCTVEGQAAAAGLCGINGLRTLWYSDARVEEGDFIVKEGVTLQSLDGSEGPEVMLKRRGVNV